MLLADGDSRYINGFISRFAQTGSDARFTYYRAEVVPWLWFLTRTADCRIFQNMTVPDIITKIFKDLGFTDFKNRLRTFEPRDYCVQYRETDFNFVSRLMEAVWDLLLLRARREEAHPGARQLAERPPTLPGTTQGPL